MGKLIFRLKGDASSFETKVSNDIKVIEESIQTSVDKEKIVEVIKYVEVPVEKAVEVIKEVPVEKIVYITKEIPTIVEKIVEKEIQTIKEVPNFIDRIVVRYKTPGHLKYIIIIESFAVVVLLIARLLK
jgi:hypothetical protein